MFSKVSIDDKGNLEMKTIKKGPSKKYKTIVITAFILLILLCFHFSIASAKRTKSAKECIYLLDNWDITINDNKNTNVDISNFTFDLVNIGDEITMERTLPKKMIKHPVLVYYQYHCMVDIFVDDELIYQTGYVEKSMNESVGFGMYTASLPEDYMGKKLRIDLHVNGMNALNSIDMVRIENEDDFVYYMLNDNIVIVITTALMIVIGVIILFFMLSLGKFEQQHRRIMEIGFLSLVSGLWSFSNYGLSKLVMDNLEMIMAFEYIMGYAIFIAVYLVFMDADYPRKLKVAAKTLAVLYCGYLLSMVITEYTNTIHTFEYLNFSSPFTRSLEVFFLVFLFYDFKKRKRYEKCIIYGLLVILFFGSIDIAKFNLKKYYNIIIPGNNYLLIGIVVFILIMIYAYIVYLREIMEQEAGRRALERMAYYDPLTKVYNRNKCEQMLMELDNLETQYIIVNFDINGLKRINDTKGHINGDSYICAFSNVLIESFNDIATIGRMGGDEFIAIILNKKREDVDKKLELMEQKAKEFETDNDCDFRISYAYGVAERKEGDKIRSQFVYEEADKLMYECKRRMKEKDPSLAIR